MTDNDRLTTFVVDDDAGVRDSVCAVLRPLKVAVETFHSAEAFLSLWGGPRPGCLVLDVRMREMSGLELQQQLVDHHDYLSIVMVTGHASVPMSVDAMKRGAFDFIEKPYPPDQLRKVVQSGLNLSSKKWTQQQRRADYEEKRRTLSPREGEIYAYLLRGFENKQIALTLGISPSTVEKHRLAVVKKMETENVTQLFRQKFDATGTIIDPASGSDQSEQQPESS